MKILVLTSRLPAPPDRGDRLRAGAFVADLAREHEVHVVSFIAGRDERRHIVDLERRGALVDVVARSPLTAWTTVALNAWRRAPLQVLYYRSRRMRHLVDGLRGSAGFDLVYVQMLRMAPYVLDSGAARPAYRIVDLTDVVSSELERSLPYRAPAKRLVARIEARRVATFERAVAARADEIWLISERERQQLAATSPAAHVVVIPNRLDVARFERPRDVAALPGRVTFVGNFDVAHNLDAARFLVDEILPKIRLRVPSATVRLVGPGGSRAIARLARVDRVSATGWVDDLVAELFAADLFVAPLRFCAGVQNKVVEAMAAGTAVVTTSLVRGGLGAVAGEHLVVADGADDLAKASAELLLDPVRRDRIGAAGRTFAHRHFSGAAASARVAAIAASPAQPSVDG